ncbi:MAG TPA: LysR family transcriptional regulator [Terrimesophilobacter sp.]|nr:LysR family transcriptional regulator [Terrimesophilobacter sp.]
MLNPWRLVILRAVLEAGSINEAARNLNYSPATISQHMSALAAETGLVLFERRGRGVEATGAARALGEQSRSLLADFDRLERVVADLRGGEAEHFAIACFASAAEQWMPRVVQDLRAARPNLTVEVSLNEPGAGRGRRMPDLDVRTEHAGPIELSFDGYDRHELLVEDLVAVLSTKHPLASRNAVGLEELADEAWVDHDIYDSPTGQIVQRACAAAGFTPRFAARLDDHRAALRFVEAGVGVTILPMLATVQVGSGVVVRPISGPAIRRRIVVHVSREARRADLVAPALVSLRRASGS